MSILFLSYHRPGFDTKSNLLLVIVDFFCIVFSISTWSHFPPAIVCCVSCSGIRLIISMSSHSYNRYTQAMSPWSEISLKRSCPLPHKHTTRTLTLTGFTVPMSCFTCMTLKLLDSHELEKQPTLWLRWWAEKLKAQLIILVSLASQWDELWPVKNWLWQCCVLLCQFVQRPVIKRTQL